jgi:hypothetical protein
MKKMLILLLLAGCQPNQLPLDVREEPVFSALPVDSFPAESQYEGPWHTSKNKTLDGIMKCTVTNLGNDSWRGRFYGRWQGVDFDYTVEFKGTPSKLEGTATIDGASYTWTGEMEKGSHFKGSFTGSRYTGYFDLRSK